MTRPSPAALGLIRVDHVGSLVRPQKLREVFLKHARGEASDKELRRVQDEAVHAIIAKQEAHNLPVLTDGEFRRHNFQESFSASVEGFEVPKEAPLFYYERMEANTRPLERAEQDFNAPGPAIITRRPVIERLCLVRNQPLEEYRFSQSVAARPVKVTLISPDRISQRFAWEKSRHIYDGLDDFVDHVVSIERQMVRELVEAGCRYIQIDAPGYTAYVDKISLERMRSRGEDPDENLDRSIRADNAVIENFPGVTFGIHICRGNARTTDPKTGKLVPQWHREGHYDAIAEQLFNGLKHRRLLLEYDSERAGSFEALRFVPKGKIVVLGLITTKSPELETADELKRRIDDAARYLPLDQLALSPQCGFGGLSGKVLSEDDMWRKLDRMMETAAQVWG